MFTDMVGYTALGQRSESLSLALVSEQRKLLRPIFKRHHGREIKSIGDAFLVEFPSALDATRCAYDIQRATREFNISLPEDRRVHLRVGVHLGDVVESKDHDISGDAVNVASRIEALAEHDGVCLTRQVYDHVQNKFELSLQSIGIKSLKNVSAPLEVYRMVMPWEQSALSTKAGPSQKETHSNVQLDRHRIAVLPFASLSPNPNDEYFADGMTEELISVISKIVNLKVIARTSAMAFKNKDKKIDQIAKELQVGTILEGSVRKAGNKLRITVQLIDSQSGDHLWAESYDRVLKDIFAIQSEISKTVAQALKVQLVPLEIQRIETQPTKNMEAYVLYLKGKQNYTNYTAVSHRRAAQFLEEAIRLDPEFALAYANLSFVYSTGLYEAASYDEAVAKAEKSARRALELDKDLAEAHIALGNIQWYKSGFSREGLLAEYGEVRTALQLNPNSPFAHAWIGADLLYEGKFEEALQEFRKALELDPLSVIFNLCLGIRLYCKHQYQEALNHIDNLVHLHGQELAEWGHFWKAKIYIQLSRYEEAIEELEKGIKMTEPKIVPLFKSNLALALAKQGKRKEARKLLKELKAIPPNEISQSPPNSENFAAVDVALGDKEEALGWLASCYQGKIGHSLVMLKIEPSLDELRSDQRFIAFLRKIGLNE